jgi:hypothetical protein
MSNNLHGDELRSCPGEIKIAGREAVEHAVPVDTPRSGLAFSLSPRLVRSSSRAGWHPQTCPSIDGERPPVTCTTSSMAVTVVALSWSLPGREEIEAVQSGAFADRAPTNEPLARVRHKDQ